MRGTALLVAMLAMLFFTVRADALEGGGRTNRRRDNSPGIGQMAPDFELVTLKHLLRRDKLGASAVKRDDPKVGTATGSDKPAPKKIKEGHVRLSQHRGKHPVVFVLTSYT